MLLMEKLTLSISHLFNIGILVIKIVSLQTRYSVCPKTDFMFDQRLEIAISNLTIH